MRIQIRSSVACERSPSSRDRCSFVSARDSLLCQGKYLANRAGHHYGVVRVSTPLLPRSHLDPNLFWQLPATGLELICECVYLRLTLPLQKIFVLRCSHLPLTLAAGTINYVARAAINVRIST